MDVTSSDIIKCILRHLFFQVEGKANKTKETKKKPLTMFGTGRQTDRLQFLSATEDFFVRVSTREAGLSLASPFKSFVTTRRRARALP